LRTAAHRTTSLHKVDQGWTKLGFSIIGTYNGSDISIWEGNTVVHTEHVDFVVYNGFNEDNEVDVGSWTGHALAFRGFIYDFKFAGGDLA
jgi:hypothetical protein